MEDRKNRFGGAEYEVGTPTVIMWDGKEITEAEFKKLVAEMMAKHRKEAEKKKD